MSIAGTAGEALPSKIGRYQILGLLGEGGMAVVYDGYDATLGRAAAVKVLRCAADGHRSSVETFLQEALKVVQLEAHRAIVTVYEADIDGDRPFIAMRKLLGGSLDHLLHKRGVLPLSVVRRVVAAIGGALDYAHRRGIVHCDVKPANILLDHLGQPYLSDFGISRARGDALGAAEVVPQGHTPRYASPEQHRGLQANALSDIYSLGVVAYEMCTGTTPFGHLQSLDALREAVLVDDPCPPRAVNPSVSAALEAVLLRAIAREPARRFPTAKALVRALLAAVADADADAELASAEHADAERADAEPAAVEGAAASPAHAEDAQGDAEDAQEAPRRTWRRLTVAGVLLAGLAAAGVAATLLGLQRPASEAPSTGQLAGALVVDFPPRPEDGEGRPMAKLRGDGLLPSDSAAEPVLDAIPPASPAERQASTSADAATVAGHVAGANQERIGTNDDSPRERPPDEGALAAPPHVEPSRAAEPADHAANLQPGPAAAPAEAAAHERPWRPVHVHHELPPSWKVAVRDATPGPLTDLPRRVRDVASGIELVLIEPGLFTMGSDEDGPHAAPAHQVAITRPFYLGVTEVTFAQMQSYAREAGITQDALWRQNPFTARAPRLHHAEQWSESQPAVRMTWAEAAAFCSHYGLRLPTEAEWEYAARAGTTTRWWFGDATRSGRGCESLLGQDTQRLAKTPLQPLGIGEPWPFADAWLQTAPVGSLAANPWGLHDMIGNVREWVLDRYARYAPAAAGPRRDPENHALTGPALARGGAWDLEPARCLPTTRHLEPATAAWDNLGFRVARDVR